MSIKLSKSIVRFLALHVVHSHQTYKYVPQLRLAGRVPALSRDTHHPPASERRELLKEDVNCEEFGYINHMAKQLRLTVRAGFQSSRPLYLFFVLISESLQL